MKRVFEEISKEKYDVLITMDRKEQRAKIFPKGLPPEWEYGYGYYGHLVTEKDGKYYVIHTIGNSCD